MYSHVVGFFFCEFETVPLERSLIPKQRGWEFLGKVHVNPLRNPFAPRNEAIVKIRNEAVVETLV